MWLGGHQEIEKWENHLDSSREGKHSEWDSRKQGEERRWTFIGRSQLRGICVLGYQNTQSYIALMIPAKNWLPTPFKAKAVFSKWT